jgi:hypothetical protein
VVQQTRVGEIVMPDSHPAGLAAQLRVEGELLGDHSTLACGTRLQRPVEAEPVHFESNTSGNAAPLLTVVE